ncbi:MAG TPA: GNAT family N-acetyltransferase [Nocardioidaceae bacterium]|nr:GNAT family N-acetyltransferase [Nocardioidaceae bacterium]
MNRPQIRVERATDDERYVATDQIVWFEENPDVSTSELLTGLPADQRFAVDTVESGDAAGTDDSSYAGIYGVRPLDLAVPGGVAGRAQLVPCAGLTWVGVHPDHRRRGILTAMLRHHVEQTHREGVALSALHASEPAIYGRHGYGVASHTHTVTLGSGTKLQAPGLDATARALRTRFATSSDPGIAKRVRECELHAATASPGMTVAEESYYAFIVNSSRWPEQKRDKEPLRFLFAERDGEDAGLVAFRRFHHWEGGRPQGRVEVFDLRGEPAVRLALLRRLLEFDLVSTVVVSHVGDDDPIWSWVGPRGTEKVEAHENLWIRIIDLPEALALRAYAGDCDVVVDVEDPAAPWQAGVWRIRVRDGAANAERTDDPAEITLPIAVLGAAYLGGTNLVAMHRAGLLDERRAGAVAQLWRAFRTDLAPDPSLNF